MGISAALYRGNSASRTAVVTRGLYVDECVAIGIDSGASMHFVSGISLFTSGDPGTVNVTFKTAGGTTITSRPVGTVIFKDFDSNGDHHIVTWEGTYYVPHQPHDLVAVGQLKRYAGNQLDSPDFKNYV